MSVSFPSLDYQKIKNDFLQELIRAEQGKKSSISFIKHQFGKRKTPTINTVQAFVIGGTNFTTALATITKKGKIEELPDTRTQGTLPKLTKQTLLSFFKKELRGEAQALAINFAFSLKPLTGSFGEIDGILQGTTKEHRLFDLIGSPIGETLKKFLNKNIPIAVANDTVCLTFSHDSLVVGSGFNISIHTGKTTVANLEAGDFNAFPTTAELDMLDAGSTRPGQGRFEKMLSGTYLPQQFNLLAKSNGLQTQVKQAEELSQLAESKSQKIETKLSRYVLKRSASLIACAVAAVYEFKNRPQKLTFTTEGSVFWKAWQYEKNVHKELTNLHIPLKTIQFEYIPDSALHGAFALLTRTK